MKYKILILMIIPVMLLFSSCALYNKEYISESDYVSPIQIRSDENRIIVRNFNELRIAVQSIIDRYDESEENIIAFDSVYDGDPGTDIAAACKQAKTENAFCAYCVEDITYDIYKVVTYYEATITVHFAETLKNDIIKLTYSGELRKYISEAIENRLRQLVLLVDYSNYNEDDIEGMVSDFYVKNPLSAPREPNVSVGVYSGAGKQKLYEINFDYGLTQEELDLRTVKTSAFVFPGIETDEMTDLEKAVYACAYLIKNTEYSSSRSDNTAYSALIECKANSQGLSMAMIALCSRLDLDCRLVYGQKNWQNHYWNIIKIDDRFYHLDVETCINEGIEEGFLLNDESMWVTYRWDMSGYPQCSELAAYSEEMFSPYLHVKEAAVPDGPETAAGS